MNKVQSQGEAVEALVQLKMQQKEFIILCLEDSSDWSNATTRRVVMQVHNISLSMSNRYETNLLHLFTHVSV